MKTFATAELLDKLDIGQQAEMLEPVTDIVIKRTNDGIVVVKDAMSSKHIGLPLPLSPTVLRATWRLERKQISFDRALTYLRVGRKVSCEYDSQLITYESLGDIIFIAEAVDGKWYLEE
ncbi:hypothetical protein [Paenibacillus sp. Mc5Re-14]|uniref:hypothetical protein n=1 Tax=Paenibacillus sp. Mc5Re-14 TaxID=1030529 RepID=UPI000A545664|nr:hypothetical protein [Paenibacillus sp. Mc5Re-14]